MAPLTRETRRDAHVVTALINTADDNFGGYRPEHAKDLAYDIALVFDVDGDTPELAAEAVFAIGNRMGADVDGKTWPSWCRSLSVGDVLLVRGWDVEGWADLAVAPVGYEPVEIDDHGQWNMPGGRAKMANRRHAARER